MSCSRAPAPGGRQLDEASIIENCATENHATSFNYQYPFTFLFFFGFLFYTVAAIPHLRVPG